MTGPLRTPLLLFVLLLAGCGMYGSLYLEEDPGRATPEVTEGPPVDADDNEDEDEENAAGPP